MTLCAVRRACRNEGVICVRLPEAAAFATYFSDTLGKGWHEDITIETIGDCIAAQAKRTKVDQDYQTRMYHANAQPVIANKLVRLCITGFSQVVLSLVRYGLGISTKKQKWPKLVGSSSRQPIVARNPPGVQQRIVSTAAPNPHQSMSQHLCITSALCIPLFTTQAWNGLLVQSLSIVA
jgi:hypothetical protein